MLSDRYPIDRLRDVLLSRADYRPFPTVHDRGDWEGILASVREAHIARG